MNGDEDLGEDITMKGNKFHFNQQPSANGCGPNELAQADGICLFKALAQEEPKAEKVEALEPEKVHTLDPKIAKSHTTFYNRDLIQLNGEGEGEGSTDGYPRPEQVHNLDPMVYTNISNMQGHVLNPSTGFRTAFYNKQNTDQVSDMQLIQSAETPAVHPYNYEPWVYQFSRDNIRPYSGHINDNPEDSRPKS